MRPLLIVGLFAACPSATAPSVRDGPRGPRASDHYAAARDQLELARERAIVSPMQELEPGAQEMRVRATAVRESAVDLERLARAHRAEAAALEADYEDACATLPFDKVTSSPFRRYAISGWTTESGVMLYLRGGVEPAQLEAEVRCHRAWLMIAPTTTSDDSALDLPDLKLDIERTPDGLSVAVSIANRRLVPELRRRVARDLEDRIIARSE